MTITRFAPSPTGYLHVGNIRTALIAWLFAKVNNGKFILRIDDTDKERSKSEFTEAIIEDLTWLGLSWDRIEYQSNRLNQYEQLKQQLINMGRLYPCYETIEELEVKKKLMLGRNLPPIYDRAALKLTAQQKEDLEARGIKPHWRFLINEEDISWQDGVKGLITFKAANISDPVLIRADGSMTYTLATICDDCDFGITDIIRGEDHVTNSAIHAQIFKALDRPVPNFSHLSLLKSKEGEISKRLGGFDIKSLRSADIEPMAICSFLAKIGTSDPVEAHDNLEKLIAEFDIHKFSKSPVTYNLDELERINTKLVHNLSFEQVKPRLQHLEIDNHFWDAVKGNLHTVHEVEMWLKICNTQISQAPATDKDFLREAAEVLPNEPFNENTWEQWVTAIKAKTGRSGKALFMPLRQALTGMEHGPELKHILPLIGRAKAIQRLQ